MFEIKTYASYIFLERAMTEQLKKHKKIENYIFWFWSNDQNIQDGHHTLPLDKKEIPPKSVIHASVCILLMQMTSPECKLSSNI